MVSPSLQTAALSRVLVAEGGMRGLLSAIPTSPSPFCQSHTFLLTPTFSQTHSLTFSFSLTRAFLHTVLFPFFLSPSPPHHTHPVIAP